MKPMQILRRAALLAGLSPVLAAPSALSQSNWPERPVRIIVPFPGGSTPDTAARVLVPHFAEVFGQPFIVENRAGAGGNIGTEAVARATDGHTLGVSINGPLATAPALFPNLSYDPVRDLAPISLLVRTGQVLVVHPSVPALNFGEFVAHARANPGRLSFGSVGAGSGGHLAMADLMARTGTDMVHVPYRGFPQAVVDLVAGRIQAMVIIVSGILPQLREGLARPLAVTAATRVPQLPEVPTLVESGLAGADSYAWIGLIGPATMPAERVARLSAEARRALGAAAARTRMETAGFQVTASTEAEFRSFIAEEAARWGGLIRQRGIQPES
jgi:tripartite-type tricarboxylate transporter receptor subunit TctC